MKVVDASVVLGWLLGQAGTAGGTAVLDAHVSGAEPLVAPELLHYEIGNALVRGVGLSRDLARQAYEHFEALEVETYSLGASEYDTAISIAAEHRVTAYDAAYAALAIALGCRFVTADRKLARALAGLGVTDVV